jgi:hypothetical protein
MRMYTSEKAQTYAAGLESTEHFIAERIALGIGLERDPELAERLSTTVSDERGAEHRVILVDANGPVLFLEESAIVECRIDYPRAMERPTRTLVEADAGTKHELWLSIKRSNSREYAESLTNLLVRNPEILDRETFKQLFRWRHLYAPSAYRWVTLASLLLDENRKAFKQTVLKREMQQRHVLKEYQRLLNMARALLCLACSGPDDTWISEMALSFSWQTWTPSIALSRERSMLAALQSATAASAFGAAVIDNYLIRIERADSLLHIYDAVLGLTSIANRYRTCIDRVLAKMLYSLQGRINDHPESQGVIEALGRSAELSLQSPNAACSRVEAWSHKGTTFRSTESYGQEDGKSAFVMRNMQEDCDGAGIADGYFPAILAIPFFDALNPEDFYLPKMMQEGVQRGVPSNIRKLLLRSNTETIDLPEHPNLTLH